MAIEIRELVIRTTVVEKVNVTTQKSGFSKQELEKLKAEIIESCFEKVKNKLSKDQER